MNKEGNDGWILNEGANKMADLIFNFFKENSQFQPYHFAIIGYATELFMRYLCDQSGNDYDRISENYRDFLRVAHKDIKAFKIEDLTAN